MQARGIGIMQNFGVVQPTGVVSQTALYQHNLPLLVRFFGKLVLDILPAALASVIGGFLFTQYQFGHTAAPRPATEQAAPASAEMMQLVRDEHAMIVNYLKTQMAAQKSRLAAEDEETAHAAAEAKAAMAAAAHRIVAAGTAPKAITPRSKTPVVATVSIPAHAPLVIARAEPNDAATAVEGPAPQPQTLLAKTLDIKDHVVDGALHVVSAIGSIPSWIASMGDRIGGTSTGSEPAPRQYSAS
jgi:hypothetical protein